MKQRSILVIVALAASGLAPGGCAPAAVPSASARPEANAENRPAEPAPAEAAPSPGTSAAAAPSPGTPAPQVEPERVTVQHILISFAGKLPDKPVSRSQEEARALAYDLLARARRGEDFDGLLRQFTDDQAPGIYSMCNRGRQPVVRGEYPREGMVPSFGDVAFGLSVGELGLADYDPQKSPYGYHLIKRLK